VIAFFDGLVEEGKGRSSQRNYLYALRSYFKTVVGGNFYNQLRELDIGKLSKKQKQILTL
jgi:hypothetical protein